MMKYWTSSGVSTNTLVHMKSLRWIGQRMKTSGWNVKFYKEGKYCKWFLSQDAYIDLGKWMFRKMSNID